MIEFVYTLLAIFIAFVVRDYLVPFLRKKGENSADIQDNFKKAKQSQLGENAATKEDIEEITRKIEGVRNEISFENQRKHQLIEERKLHVISLLNNLEKLNSIRYGLAFQFQNNNVKLLEELISKTNDIIYDIISESRIIFVISTDEELNKKVSKVRDMAIECYKLISIEANNLLKIFNQKNLLLGLVYKQTNENALRGCEEQIKESETQCETNIKNALDQMYDSVISYTAYLSKLYNQDFCLKWEYDKN